MKIEEIQSLWEKDSKIDKSELDMESLRIPELHNKYYKIYMVEKLVYRKMQNDHNILLKLKQDYYLGKFSDEDYKNTGWSLQNKIILKADLGTHLDSDNAVCGSLLNLTAQLEKVAYLESIVKNLNTRNFIIKNAIDFLKWSSGGS